MRRGPNGTSRRRWSRFTLYTTGSSCTLSSTPLKLQLHSSATTLFSRFHIRALELHSLDSIPVYLAISQVKPVHISKSVRRTLSHSKMMSVANPVLVTVLRIVLASRPTGDNTASFKLTGRNRLLFGPTTGTTTGCLLSWRVEMSPPQLQ